MDKDLKETEWKQETEKRRTSCMDKDFKEKVRKRETKNLQDR